MEFVIQAFLELMKPGNFIIMLFSSFLGIIFGAIPGLSGGLGVSLLLPLTFGMDKFLGFSMLIGMWIGGISGSFISATLVGIPGSASSIATCYDAYPMSKNGQTVRALSIGIIGSAIGTLASIVIAAFFSPIISDLALKLGPWEYFSLCFCAITLVASLSQGSLFKSLLSAFIGLAISQIGMDPITGSFRYTFGNIYLTSGVDMVSIMLGIFAISMIVHDSSHGIQEMPNVSKEAMKMGKSIKLKDIIACKGVIARAMLIGLWIGFLPGMGSGLSNMVSYAQNRAASKHPEKYGTGCDEGIFASEVANNASVGGAIIPMMSLGIPGDAVTALLLSGLMIHGLQPGPLFITSNGKLAYFFFVAAFVSAVLVLILEKAGMKFFPLLLKAPYHYLYGVILIMCFVGAYTGSNSLFNVGLMLIFSIIALCMMSTHIPTSPLILAYILGPKLEEYFRKGISYSDKGISEFITRPISLIFLLLAVFSVLFTIMKNRKPVKKEN